MLVSGCCWVDALARADGGASQSIAKQRETPSEMPKNGQRILTTIKESLKIQEIPDYPDKESVQEHWKIYVKKKNKKNKKESRSIVRKSLEQIKKTCKDSQRWTTIPDNPDGAFEPDESLSKHERIHENHQRLGLGTSERLRCSSDDVNQLLEILMELDRIF